MKIKSMKMRKTMLLLLLIPVALFLGVIIYGYSLLEKINYIELSASDEELGITPVPESQSNEDKVPGGKDGPVSNGNAVAVTNDHGDIKKDNRDTHHVSENIKGVTNIALFGLDRRNPGEASRSDAMMVVSLDKKNRKIKVSSLMRDMYVPIPGKGETRINAAYAYGGAELAIKTVNSNFGLDIRNYAAVDFTGFEKLIDKVGGIEIAIKDYEVSEIEGVTKDGLQALNGRQALDYVRIRHKGNADYERTDRQRYMLDVLFKKIKAQGLAKLPETVSALLPYVETSLSKTEIIQLALELAGYGAESVEQFRLPVDGYFTNAVIRDMVVLLPDIEENKSLLHSFIYGTGNSTVVK